MTENQLKMRLAADLDGHFPALVAAYQDRLYRFALRLSGSPQDAEEITQDALIRAYRALGGFADQRMRELQLRPWMYTIAMNVFRNRARVNRVATIGLDGSEAQVSGSNGSAPQEDHATRLVIEEMIRSLPEHNRVSLVLRHIEGLSYAEIASIVEQPIGTVKANVHRALASLRHELSSEAGV